jgi:hypothetical protein
MADNTTPTLPAKTPDITPVQILAVLQPIAATFVVFGILKVTDQQLQIVLPALSGAISAVWLLSDTLIRRGRSRAIAALATPDIMSLAVDAVLKSQAVLKTLDPVTGAVDVSAAKDPGDTPAAFQPGAFGDDPAATHAAGDTSQPLTDGPPPPEDGPARPERA